MMRAGVYLFKEIHILYINKMINTLPHTLIYIYELDQHQNMIMELVIIEEGIWLRAEE